MFNIWWQGIQMTVQAVMGTVMDGNVLKSTSIFNLVGISESAYDMRKFFLRWSFLGDNLIKGFFFL